MKKLLTLIAIFCCCGAIIADEGPAKKPSSKPMVIKMNLLPSRHFTVDVMINGKGPYKFILDTGAPINLINSRTAKATNLKEQRQGGLFGGLVGGVAQSIMKLVKIGDAKAENIPAMVMDHPTVEAISNAFGPIEGIIGFPFFARYAMTVDYQKRTITLTPNAYKPGDYMQDLMNNLLRLEERNQAKPVVSGGLIGILVEKKDADDKPGVTVKSVFPKSPAAQAGLKVGDRLLTLDGRWTDSISDTFDAASLIKPGREIEVQVQRGEKKLTLKMTPERGN